MARAVDAAVTAGTWEEDPLKSKAVSTGRKRGSYVDADVKQAAGERIDGVASPLLGSFALNSLHLDI